MGATAEIRHNESASVAVRVRILPYLPNSDPSLIKSFVMAEQPIPAFTGHVTSPSSARAHARARTHARGNLQTESNLCAGSWTVGGNHKPTLMHVHPKVTIYK